MSASIRTRIAALALGLWALAGGIAQAEEMALDMVLNWKYQGTQAPFFLADERGYFADAGIDITIDQGDGSAAAVHKVASGAYDVGFGDVNALIQFAAQNPGENPLMVYMIFNRPPFTIAVRSDSNIREPADLEGTTLAGAANDGALKLFPAFANITGIDRDSIEIITIEPSLREQMLDRGEVDGVFGYVNTIRFSAMLAGIDPAERFRFVRYDQFGMDLYSNGLIVSRDLVENHPDVVRGLVSAVNRGFADTLADMEAGMDAVMNRESLLKRDIERKRLERAIDDMVKHADVAETGLGAVRAERFNKATGIVVEANDLPRTPAMEEVFVDDFLPPANERIHELDY